MAPHAGKPLEIGGATAGSVGVVPEHHRHRRKRRGADQLALLAANGRPLVVPDVNRPAETWSLYLAAQDEPDWVPAHEPAIELGPAGDGRELNTVINLFENVVERYGYGR